MVQRICSVDECGKPAQCRGWCQGHYTRWYKTGDVAADIPLRGRAVGGTAVAFFEEAMLLETDDCILWPHARDRNGYGYLKFRGEIRSVNNHALRYRVGAPPADGRYDAAHSCRNRNCFNYRHLSWKSRRDNLLDKRADGTAWNGNRKLGVGDVVEIFTLRRDGVAITALAERYGVTPWTVRSILSGKSWSGYLTHLVEQGILATDPRHP